MFTEAKTNPDVDLKRMHQLYIAINGYQAFDKFMNVYVSNHSDLSIDYSFSTLNRMYILFIFCISGTKDNHGDGTKRCSRL